MGDINIRIAEVVKKSGLTKTAFAGRINVSQQHVSRLVKDGNPSDRTIYDICREFKISEKWLRTGEGEMFLPLSRDEEIAAYLGQIMSDDEDSFRRRMISVLCRLNTEEWAMLERMAQKLLTETKKADPEGSE